MPSHLLKTERTSVAFHNAVLGKLSSLVASHLMKTERTSVAIHNAVFLPRHRQKRTVSDPYPRCFWKLDPDRINIRVKNWIRITGSKFRSFRGSKCSRERVEAHNGGAEAKNGGLECRYASGRRFSSSGSEIALKLKAGTGSALMMIRNFCITILPHKKFLSFFNSKKIQNLVWRSSDSLPRKNFRASLMRKILWQRYSWSKTSVKNHNQPNSTR